LLAECIEDVKINSFKHQHQLNFQDLRSKYYEQKFGLDLCNVEESQAQIKQLCIEYIRGLNFVMTYYTDGIPTFDWVYPYHYAPLMCDLYEVAKSFKLMQWNQLQEWEYKQPLTLNQALLGVIPPSSRAVCPPAVTKVLQKHIDDPLFSEQFEVDLQGKQQEYEAVCLLPNVSYTQLKRMCRDKLVPQAPLEI
jgi:5'-3' exoribonuclease 2